MKLIKCRIKKAARELLFLDPKECAFIFSFILLILLLPYNFYD